MDIYDKQIGELTKSPHLIPIQWSNAKGIFAFVGYGSLSGCLTMIRKTTECNACKERYIDEELTAQIRADERIPSGPGGITVESLPVFAEWRRKIDKLHNLNT